MRAASTVLSEGCCVDAPSPVSSRHALISLMIVPSGFLAPTAATSASVAAMLAGCLPCCTEVIVKGSRQLQLEHFGLLRCRSACTARMRAGASSK